MGKDKDAIESSMEGDTEGTIEGVLIPKELQVKANGGEKLEVKVLVFVLYMVRVLGYINRLQHPQGEGGRG